MRVFYKIIKSMFFPDGDPEITMDRRDICKRCEYRMLYNCRICGCNIYLKTQLRDEKCPINKW